MRCITSFKMISFSKLFIVNVIHLPKTMTSFAINQQLANSILRLPFKDKGFGKFLVCYGEKQALVKMEFTIHLMLLHLLHKCTMNDLAIHP